MTYSEIRKNEEVLAFIKKGTANLGAMGFTDHSEAHSGLVALALALVAMPTKKLPKKIPANLM